MARFQPALLAAMFTSRDSSAYYIQAAAANLLPADAEQESRGRGLFRPRDREYSCVRDGSTDTCLQVAFGSPDLKDSAAKLSLPSYDPKQALTVTLDYFGLDVGSDRVARRGDWSGQVEVGIPNIMGELAFFEPSTQVPSAGGRCLATTVIEGEQFGLDGAAGWFTVRCSSGWGSGGADIVDIKLSYTPTSNTSDPESQGHFV